MRILHVTPAYFPTVGGCEVHVQRVSEGLASRGHEVTVLTANVRNIGDLNTITCAGLPETEIINGVKVVRFRPDGGVFGSMLQAWHNHVRGSYRTISMILGKDGVELFLQPPRLVQLIPHLVSAQADIVASVNWFWPPAYYVHVAKRLKPFPLVGIPLFHTAEPWCARPIYKKMLARCDAVIVNTAYEEDFAQTRGGTRVRVVGVGVDPRDFEYADGRAIRARHGLADHPVVGYVGRAVLNKGTLLLLQAMKGVWHWNKDVRLVLAGPRANREQPVDAFIASLTEFERKRIVLIDDFPDREKASIFDAFDIFVMPSTAESFGLAYLEAWMLRKAVIGARIGPTRCVIDEGSDGLLVDPHDPGETTRSIIELLSNQERREKMGQVGRAKVTARFTWDRVIDGIDNLYLEVLAAKHANRFSSRPKVRWFKSK
jgi:glycosyltransferase involved in cell wall biosynthesis